MICGAVNFAVGDRVAARAARRGAARRVRDRRAQDLRPHLRGDDLLGRELAIGDDHTGILVLPPDAPLGADFVSYAGPARRRVRDRGDAGPRLRRCPIRGVARELATAFGVPFRDPADTDAAGATCSADAGRGPTSTRPASPTRPRCDRFVLREVRGFDPAAPTPLWMRVRLARCRDALACRWPWTSPTT